MPRPPIRMLHCILAVLCLGAVRAGAGDEGGEAAVSGVRGPVLVAWYERIRDLDFDYGKVGSVLEAIAYCRLLDEHAPRGLDVLHGIQYFDADRTLGELDLVVYDPKGRRVHAVYEVKLSGNLERVRYGALEQLERFRLALRRRRIERLLIAHGGGPPPPLDAFRDCREFGLIGSRGARRARYDIEIDLARDEADVLQSWLLGRARPGPALSP